MLCQTLKRSYVFPIKVMEILQHINKRVKDQTHIKLNLHDLVTMYLDTTDSMVRNFAIVYVEMGFNR